MKYNNVLKPKSKKTFKKENCNLRERAELIDIFGNKVVLSGRHAFEWSITTYKEEGITRITFSCRKDAKKEFESIKKKNKL